MIAQTSPGQSPVGSQSVSHLVPCFYRDDATHQNVYNYVHTLSSLSNTFDLMTDQICFLGSVWSALSEYHIRFYVRPSESTVWIWFQNYSCLDLNFCCDCTMFAQTFKGFIIIGAIWKFNTVCLEISSTNKLK